MGADDNLQCIQRQGESTTQDSLNGNNFAGNKTNYKSVISDYKEKAYSQIQNNQIPAERSDVVKSYFDELTR